MESLYKFAAQNRLRFSSNKGELTVEDLYQLPLESKSSFDLNTIGTKVMEDLEKMGTKSLIAVKSTDPKKVILETQLEIIKDVIKTKQEENAKRLARAEKAEKRRKILDAMAAKDDEAISKASREDLEKQLAALED